jgi:hypothetical protein
MKKPSRKQLLWTIKNLLRLLTGREDINGTTIHQSLNPYCRPAVKEALTVLAIEQGLTGRFAYLDADIKTELERMSKRIDCQFFSYCRKLGTLNCPNTGVESGCYESKTKKEV